MAEENALLPRREGEDIGIRNGGIRVPRFERSEHIVPELPKFTDEL